MSNLLKRNSHRQQPYTHPYYIANACLPASIYGHYYHASDVAELKAINFVHSSFYLNLLRRWCKFGAKDDIPEPTSNSKAIFIVHKVVLQVILLQLFHV